MEVSISNVVNPMRVFYTVERHMNVICPNLKQQVTRKPAYLVTDLCENFVFDRRTVKDATHYS